MKILLLEAFYAGSHKLWADGLARHSSHDIQMMKMEGRHWKWRMEHSAVYFAEQIKKYDEKYDLIVATDLTNVAVLRGLLSSGREAGGWHQRVPIVLYFHENQITYPWSHDDPDVGLKRDNHYGWINYISCLSADHIFWNSDYHRRDFFASLPDFLDRFPDPYPQDTIKVFAAKSTVLPIGIELPPTAIGADRSDPPTIIWNHRWEYDKNPEAFFSALYQMTEEGTDFQLIVAGQHYKRYPQIFDEAKERLSDHIIHFGYAKSRTQYHDLLHQSDIALVTSNQDFFGISATEAIAAGCIPILPDRLAFSEQLSRPECDAYYYQNDKQMIDQLRQRLTHPLPTTLRSQVERYAWPMLIEKYDTALSSVVL